MLRIKKEYNIDYICKKYKFKKGFWKENILIEESKINSHNGKKLPKGLEYTNKKNFRKVSFATLDYFYKDIEHLQTSDIDISCVPQRLFDTNVHPRDIDTYCIRYKLLDAKEMFYLIPSPNKMEIKDYDLFYDMVKDGVLERVEDVK